MAKWLSHLDKKNILFTILFLAVFSKVPETWFKSFRNVLSSNAPYASLNYFDKNFGDDLILPKETIEIEQIAAHQNLSFFSLSPLIQKNSVVYQRTVESLFPRQIKLNESKRFFLTQEDVSNCQLIEKKEKVLLADCP